MKNPVYSVTVSNIGTVYTGNGRDAKRVFATYRKQSLENYGRAAGEDVTQWRDGEPVREFIGSLSLNS